ncbi:hypothetical protein HPY86_03765 [candidate division WOR-3 bacterium]|jgi:hypothetical protein|nr:hypothetical protein [candidate division WOR-3 bacterium]
MIPEELKKYDYLDKLHEIYMPFTEEDLLCHLASKNVLRKYYKKSIEDYKIWCTANCAQKKN